MSEQQWQDEATRYRRFMKQVETYVKWRARAHDLDMDTAIGMVNEWSSKVGHIENKKTNGPTLFGLVKPDANW